MSSSSPPGSDHDAQKLRQTSWQGKALYPEITLDCPELTGEQRWADLSPRDPKATFTGHTGD